MPLHVSSTCAHHQVVKIAFHSLWYHDTFCASSWLITEINNYNVLLQSPQVNNEISDIPKAQ